MKDFFKKLFLLNEEPPLFLGVIDGGENKDVYPFNDLVAKGSEPVWVEKKPEEWNTYPLQNQSTSSACVAFTASKIATILYKQRTGSIVKFSPGWIYKQRINRPGEGMMFDDVAKLASEGMQLDILMPSENMGEFEINNIKDLPFHKDVAKAFAIPKDWVELPLDFDTVAATQQKTGKGIMLWFRFGSNEWFGKSIPTIKSEVRWAHSVTVVDTTLYKGEKYLVIDDSSDVKGEFGHRKLIDRTFFKRAYLARYPIQFKFERGDKPYYDGTIVSAQKCLRYEGLFPSNASYAEKVGPLTKKALSDFQSKNGLAITGTLSNETVDLLKTKYQ